MEVEYRAEEGVEECTGVFKINDLNSQEMDFEIDSVTISHAGKIGGRARGILKRALEDKINELFGKMRDDLMEMESNPEKLKSDLQKREEAKKLTKEVYEQTGEIKDKMLKEQKQKELQMKMKAQK